MKTETTYTTDNVADYVRMCEAVGLRPSRHGMVGVECQRVPSGPTTNRIAQQIARAWDEYVAINGDPTAK